MGIKNRGELITSPLREQVLNIIEAGIKRVLPPVIMESAVDYNPDRRLLTLNDFSFPLDNGRLFVIGGGKASGRMAETLEKIVPPEFITAGIVNCKGGDFKTGRIEMVKAGHPVPDEAGLDGVKRMLALKKEYSVNGNDLVLCLISGGGSALMPCPVEGVSLEDKQIVTELLLSSGADINEINSVRKHLSGTKGGRLGQYFAPATVVSLILSDVIGNNLDVIASGPTCPDPSTFADACGVLEKYDLLTKVPESVSAYLVKGCSGEVPETPKILGNCRNFIIGDNRMALEEMEKEAVRMGFVPYIITAEQKGATAIVARLRAGEILGGEYDKYDLLLIGGETTPKLPGNPGKGGRNQHYAAVSMIELKDYPGEWVLASVGTDGSDYLPDVAGAIVDNNTLAIANEKGIDVESYLIRYDSNTLLKAISGSLVITGNTGTNVGDVIVYALK
ncbi:glycerate kinase [Chloroflexota bacterium]